MVQNPRLRYSQLVSLLTDGILNLLSLFEFLAGPHQPLPQSHLPYQKVYVCMYV